MDEILRQQLIDQVHLRVLSLCYKINAGIAVFYSLFGLLYAGIFFFISPFGNHAWRGSNIEPPPENLGWFFAIFGFIMFSSMIVIAALNWYVARCLQARRSRIFCQLIAALNCIYIPYGAALGVCTFIVLARSTVASLFEINRAGSSGV